MADKKKDHTDFDDDAFDVEDFSDADYDENLSDDGEFAEVGDDDVEYADEDFGEDDWEQEEGAKKNKGKKDKSLISGGSDKKGLSFNTMVIIGAVVVGCGVLVFKVMSETSAQKSSLKERFTSIMSMSGVMDGVLSGGNEDAPTAEDLAAREQRSQEEGFLNNPDAANPPPPTPIAPAENTNEPLTAMPGDANQMPRGPEETPPGAAQQTDGTIPPAGSVPAEGQQVPVVPLADANKTQDAPSDVPLPTAANEAPGTTPSATPSNPSAEDILKQAMANRGQKASSDQAQNAATPEQAATPANTEQQAPSTNSPSVPSASAEQVAANEQAVKSLEEKIDALVKRMDSLESNVGSVKNEEPADYEELQKTVASLKEELQTIKNRPVSDAQRKKAAPVKETTEPDDIVSAETDEPKPAPAPKKRTKVTAPAATSAQASSPKASSSRWELRAAQPGRAWVSKPGDRDMQSVEVGQTLPGIGKVTSIGYQNGRWTVYGSQGQINQ